MVCFFLSNPTFGNTALHLVGYGRRSSILVHPSERPLELDQRALVHAYGNGEPSDHYHALVYFAPALTTHMPWCNGAFSLHLQFTLEIYIPIATRILFLFDCAGHASVLRSFVELLERTKSLGAFSGPRR